MSDPLKKMMDVIIRNSGAARGLLFIKKDNQWLIKIEGVLDKNKITFSEDKYFKKNEHAPSTLIKQVSRTEKPVILSDAAQDGKFTHDEYIKKQQSKSILVFPLFGRGKLNGILYLENNFITGAFSIEQVQIINLLAAQAEICIENQILFEEKNNTLEKLAQEISKRKKTEKKLKKKESLLKFFFDNTNDIIFYIDVEGENEFRFKSVNAAFQKAVGLKASDIEGKLVNEIIPEPSLSMVLSNYKKAIQGKKTIKWKETTEYSPGNKIGEVTITPIFNKMGICTKLVGSVYDITELEYTEMELKKSENRFKSIFNQAAVGVARLTLDGTWLEVNKRFCDIIGYSQEELFSKTFQEITHLDNLGTGQSLFNKLIKNKIKTYSIEKHYFKKNGDSTWIKLTLTLMHDLNNAPDYLISIVDDISERKKAEEQLKEQSTFINKIIENSTLSIWISDEKGTAIKTNPACLKFFGATEEEVIGKYNLFNDNVIKKNGFMPEIDKVFKKGEVANFIIDYDFGSVYHVNVKNPTHRIINSIITPITDINGKVTNAIVQTIDLTEIKKTEKALIESQERYQKAQVLGHVGNWEYNIETTKFWGSDEAKRIYGFEPGIENFTTDEVENCIVDKKKVHQALIDLIERDKKYDLVFDIITRDKGIRKTLHSIATLEKDAQGKPLRISGVVNDITLRKQFEEKLKESEENLLITLNSIGDAVIATDREGKITRMNPVAESLTGWNAKEAKGTTLTKVFNIVNAHTREALENPVNRVMKTGKIVALDNQTLLISRDGVERQIADSGAPIRNYKGKIIGIVLVFRDITKQYKIEEQLRQSQKMDAVGQLAGGVAHDFNNMLTGILGCADLLGEYTNKNNEIKEYVDLIIDSSMQAKELTQKLLTFSHKGQMIRTVFDIHDSIKKVSTMLKRIIDKRIKIKTILNADLSTLNCDKSQMQNAILNLGINARDAMPEGGQLTFKTKNVNLDATIIGSNFKAKPGNYIEINVEDTGIGMSQEIKDHVFEPFFTTKGLGKGTGLGLSVIYNTIQENKGFINIYSEINKGTVVKIYLPAYTKEQILKKPKAKEEPVYGHGCILVADDEKIVQIMAKEMLTRLGYEVLFASDGEETIKLYNKKKTVIDLVLLDIIMPEINGRDVFYKLKTINPDVRILISSGFAQDTNISHLVEDGALGFIQKPYRLIDLSKKIRDALS